MTRCASAGARPGRSHLGTAPRSGVGFPGGGGCGRPAAGWRTPPTRPHLRPEATTAVLWWKSAADAGRRRAARRQLDEALRRFDLRDAFDELGAELAVKERDTFAGLWIEHTPEYRIVVRFTRDGEETMQRYIAGQPYAEIVEVRGADLTLIELEALRVQMVRIADELGIPQHSATNIEENRIEVWLPDPDDVAGLEEALREAGMRVPEHVMVFAPVVVEPAQ